MAGRNDPASPSRKPVLGAGTLLVGTSGWSYQHWHKRFYPEEVSPDKWLEYYTHHFPTVEINSSFYHLPQARTFAGWNERTPGGFVFSVKASRYLTHVLKLGHAEEAWRAFIDRAKILGGKLGPILFQLPPGMKADEERLRGFLAILPDDYRYAFEFRHLSWFNDHTYAHLRAKGAGLVVADSPRYPTAFETTAPFVFVRMHGGSQLYSSEYTKEELAAYAERIRGWLAAGLAVYVYFNNDAYGFAIKNARELTGMLRDIGRAGAGAATAAN